MNIRPSNACLATNVGGRQNGVSSEDVGGRLYARWARMIRRVCTRGASDKTRRPRKTRTRILGVTSVDVLGSGVAELGAYFYWTP